jgi:hypothetical protein
MLPALGLGFESWTIAVMVRSHGTGEAVSAREGAEEYGGTFSARVRFRGDLQSMRRGELLVGRRNGRHWPTRAEQPEDAARSSGTGVGCGSDRSILITIGLAQRADRGRRQRPQRMNPGAPGLELNFGKLPCPVREIEAAVERADIDALQSCRMTRKPHQSITARPVTRGIALLDHSVLATLMADHCARDTRFTKLRDLRLCPPTSQFSRLPSQATSIRSLASSLRTCLHATVVNFLKFNERPVVLPAIRNASRAKENFDAGPKARLSAAQFAVTRNSRVATGLENAKPFARIHRLAGRQRRSC